MKRHHTIPQSRVRGQDGRSDPVAAIYRHINGSIVRRCSWWTHRYRWQQEAQESCQYQVGTCLLFFRRHLHSPRPPEPADVTRLADVSIRAEHPRLCSPSSSHPVFLHVHACCQCFPRGLATTTSGLTVSLPHLPGCCPMPARDCTQPDSSRVVLQEGGTPAR
jgi:hypothetical protein